MPDFTQRKWRYLESSREIFAPATQIEDDPFGLAIADISFDPDIPEKEKNANGRLIANAPDMYIALKKCVEFINHIKECSLALDADGLRDYLENILKRIDCPENDKEED